MTYRVSVGLSRRYKAWYAPSSISKATVVWRVFRSVSCPWSSKRPLQCWKSAVSSAALRISLCPPRQIARPFGLGGRRSMSMIYPAAPGIWVCQHVVPPIAGLVVFWWKDCWCGEGTSSLAERCRCGEIHAGRGSLRSVCLRLLIQVVWINTASRPHL
jgi:hypothetical protein